MNSIYTNPQDDSQYQIIDYCTLQIENQSIDAYIYVHFPKISGVYSHKQVCPIKDFHKKFIKSQSSTSISDSCSILERLRNHQLHIILGKYKLWH